MSNCCSCKYAKKYECGGPGDSYTEWYCVYDKDVKGKIIPHPHFMGGKRRCLCYKKREKEYDVFVYPTPNEDLIPVVRCRDCVYSQPWYRDKRLCFLWADTGIDVFEDGFCNYGRVRE